MVNLLYIEDDDTGQGHYIYIKKLERLMNTMSQADYKDRRHCPYCKCSIACKNESYDDHMKRKHFSTTNNCNLELPKHGATMKFKNYKDLIL